MINKFYIACQTKVGKQYLLGFANIGQCCVFLCTTLHDCWFFVFCPQTFQHSSLHVWDVSHERTLWTGGAWAQYPGGLRRSTLEWRRCDCQSQLSGVCLWGSPVFSCWVWYSSPECGVCQWVSWGRFCWMSGQVLFFLFFSRCVKTKQRAAEMSVCWFWMHTCEGPGCLKWCFFMCCRTSFSKHFIRMGWVPQGMFHKCSGAMQQKEMSKQKLYVMPIINVSPCFSTIRRQIVINTAYISITISLTCSYWASFSPQLPDFQTLFNGELPEPNKQGLWDSMLLLFSYLVACNWEMWSKYHKKGVGVSTHGSWLVLEMFTQKVMMRHSFITDTSPKRTTAS